MLVCIPVVFIGDGPVVVRSGRRGMRHLRLHLVCTSASVPIYTIYIYIHTRIRETNVKPIENNNNKCV